MKNIGYIIIASAIASCTTGVSKIEVTNIGELRQIMHQGQFQARVRLDSLIGEHVFGLGALDSLSGEVIVLDDQVYSSRLENETLVIDNSSQAEATLFVYSEVSKWDTLEVSNFTDIGELISKRSKEARLEAPFPFLLIGAPELLDYHVINFNPEISDFSNHKEGAFTEALSKIEVLILGFYATDAKGIYTHHDSDLHMHFIDVTEERMGHIDDIVTGTGSFNLLIPKQ